MAKPSPAEEAALRQRVGNILMSRPCQRINISVDRVSVNGSGFSYVALSVLNTIQFAIGDLPADFEAQYSIGSNTFRFPHSGYGAGGPRAALERQTIVHEATHAVIDATSSNRSVLKMTHELAGLMTGALYNAFCADYLAAADLFTPSPTDAIYGTAHRLAQSVAAGIKAYKFAGCWIMTPEFLAPLSRAILAHSAYQSIRDNPAGTYGDDGLPLVKPAA